MSGRAYVFHEFVWVDSHYPWPVESYREWPPRTPLNAFISGPSAGGPWDEGDTAPRAVSEEYFNIVCPRQERKIINTRDVKPALREADGKVIFERWRTLLAETKERCVEVVAAPREEDPFPETFDIFYWSGPRSLSLWYDFVQSPISRLLRASPIVKSAIEDNIGLFTSSPLPSLPSSKNHGKDLLRDTFASVFSIHIRSGDFKGACIEHAAMNSTFYNWNLLPFLPDRMNTSRQHEQNKRQILQRCWPNKEYIRERVNEAWQAYKDSQTAPSTGRELPVLYIMSNDRTDWLNGLKEEFQQDGWRRVVLSRELELKPEQKDVSVAVDMEIGRQSAVFIGNGVSPVVNSSPHFWLPNFFFCSGHPSPVTWFTGGWLTERCRSVFAFGNTDESDDQRFKCGHWMRALYLIHAEHCLTGPFFFVICIGFVCVKM